MAKTKTKRIKVEVTEQHIKDGWAGSPWVCPVARALLDAGMENVYVGITSVDFGRDNPAGPLSAAAKKFIRAFDLERPVKPFSFMLTVPR